MATAIEIERVFQPVRERCGRQEQAGRVGAEAEQDFLDMGLFAGIILEIMFYFE